MDILIILNHQPYDGSDVAYNALRLAKNLLERGNNLHIFLMNDAVDLAREAASKPESYDQDLVAMLKSLYEAGVKLKVCGSCQVRCGIYKNEPYFAPEIKGTMNDLAEWVLGCDRVLSF